MARLESALPGIALTLAALFLTQGLLGNREKSLTWDEPVYITGGHTALTRGEFERFTVDWGAPPLMQLLEAALVVPLDLEYPPADDAVWSHPVSLAQAFVFANGRDVRSIAFRARLPVLLIGTALVLGIVFWARQLYGIWPAICSGTLAAFSPNLLAHAKLATTDLGCTAAMFFAVWSFHGAIERGRIRDALLCGVLTGLALLTKFTALLLAPIYLLLGAAAWWSRRKSRSLASVALPAIAALLATLAVVSAGYGSTTGLFLYWRALRGVYAVHAGPYSFYLLGAVSDTPWWYYYLVAFLLKVPVATLGLLVLAVGVAIRSAEHRRATLFCLVPAGVVVAASCFDATNIGLRRILPAFPFLFVLSGQAAAGAGRIRQTVATLLLAWAVAAGLWIYPHHLAYFNEVAGGPARGPFLLDDSNLDWGQDLPALARWQSARPAEERLRLLYFGTADPAAYGVRAVPFEERDRLAPRPGVYAISAHMLVWLRKLAPRADGAHDWLARYHPIARAGNSIYIYEFPPDGLP